MKRTRLTKEQMIGFLKEAEAGAKTPDLTPRHGVLEATFYNLQAKCGGPDVSETKARTPIQRGGQYGVMSLKKMTSAKNGTKLRVQVTGQH